MRKSHLISFIWLFIFMLLPAGTAGAGAEYKKITAPEVRHLLEEDGGVVIHVLTELEYNAQHITGSVNIPVIKMKTTDKLPKEKSTPLVFYCMGER